MPVKPAAGTNPLAVAATVNAPVVVPVAKLTVPMHVAGIALLWPLIRDVETVKVHSPETVAGPTVMVMAPLNPGVASPVIEDT